MASAGRLVKETKMILTSIERNNNKFWSAKVLDNNSVSVTFGRVGTNGATQTKAFPSAAAALRYFESKVSEKESRGYMKAKILTLGGDDDDSNASSSGSKPLFKDMLAKIASEQLFSDDEDVRRRAETDAKLALLEPEGDASASLSKGRDTSFKADDTPAASDSASASASTDVSTTGHRRHDPRELVSSLVKHLVEANTHKILAGTTMSYDEKAGSFRTPLGIVTQDAVDEARALLNDISNHVVAAAAASMKSVTNSAGVVVNPDSSDTAWKPLLERYLMLIPRDVGRYRPTLRSIFPDLDAIKNETTVLDALESSVKAVQAEAQARAASGSAAPMPNLFRAQLVPVYDEGAFASVNTFFKRGINDHHHSAKRLHLHRLYACRIDAMSDSFERAGRQVGNLRRLWHGTRPSNVLSILTTGMNVPPANSPHCTGRLYGNGLYFASQSTKSLNYSIGAAPGQSRSPRSSHASSAFMFLCHVALGKSYVPGIDGSHGSYPRTGFDSTFAKGNVSPGVLNDELIVYNTSQAKTLYLCEFR